jgi:TRAP-type C4-dicarboxylate transport system permease small subunit
MPVVNPTATSLPEEPQTSESRPMSRLEIGLIVGVTVVFVTLIFFIFLVRALDHRRRKRLLRRMAEDARNRTPEEEILCRRLAWLQVERESKQMA